ncbi:enoyl-CoA hydratase/isomerase family protein [Rhizorhabdus histidinilytica]|uniref:Enoyl-CoA hydratase n=1 Tax=Rhizorhabdus histidinilytica TaxID=439228 RepID=A0A1T5GUA8_9SPHN|nr:enoyl-CoA hydratase/isomerase family protein [Rhizorhabdus histidinilytica]SKC11964.1 enoyl-CoA hydratase [Rhizorhabdus histidinilytica]
MKNAYDYAEVKVAKDGAILRVSLNRPAQLNSTTHRMNAEVLDMLRTVDSDEEIKVVVLTGEGRAFCAGGDLFEHDEFVGDQFEREMRVHTEIIFAMLNNAKPIVCQLNGAAVGWGATFALFSDIIIASETATISDPHVHLGLSTGDGAAIIFPQLIGYPRARQMLMTGQPINGRQASEFGLVGEAVPPAELAARVTEIARTIAAMPAQAIRNTKASINIPLKNLVQQMMDTCIALEVVTQKSDDHKAALKDFVESRVARKKISAA